MNKEKTKLSLARERKRNSPETIQFRNDVIKFLLHVDATDEISYSLKRDLSVKTDMPFWKEPRGKRKVKISDIDVIVAYVEKLINYNDYDFAAKLFRQLKVQQNQTLRRLSKRSPAGKIKEKIHGKANGIWEHAIPAKFIVNEILMMIKNNDTTHLRRLLEIYQKTGQHFLTHDQNSVLNSNFRDSMPDGWSWNVDECNPYARYIKCGISFEKPHQLDEII